MSGTISGALRSLLGLAGQAVVTQYRRGFQLFWLAPVIVALVAVPEFLQHVVEIQLGMFDSRAAAKIIGNDPARWAFGYAKLTGLVLAFLAAARFWWCREHGGRWYDLRKVAWLRLGAGLVLFIGVSALAEPFAPLVSAEGLMVLRIIASLLSLPMLFLLLSGLFGDTEISLPAILRWGLPFSLLIALLLLLGYGPALLLHGLNHRLAMGAPEALVWALMLFDTLVVGLLAALVGAGITTSYEAFRSAAIAQHA